MRILLVLLVVASTVTAANADQPSRSHVAPVLPTLRLESNASGKATFKVGADVVWGKSALTDMSFSPIFQTTTNKGVSNVLSVTAADASSADVAFGFVISRIALREGTYSDEFRKAMPAALERCKLQCADKDNRDATFCAKHDKLVAAAAAAAPPSAPTFAEYGSATEYCKSEVATLTQLSKRLRDRMAEVPASTFSFGFTFGNANFQWLERSATDATILTKDKDNLKSFGVSALHTRVDADGFSLEFPARLQMRHAASSTTARLCVPAGNVPRPEPMQMESDPAEVCDDYGIGEPTRRIELQGGAYAGFVQSKNLQMRAAVGLNVLRQFNKGASEETKIAVEFPLYVAGDLFPSGAGSFKGLLRVTPAVTLTLTEKDDSEKMTFTVNLEVLVGRALFGSAADYL